MISSKKGRRFGSAIVLLQGLVTVAFPQLSAKLTKRMVGKNFDNASDLEAKPAYLRQVRAIGVGMVAAAGTHLLLESSQAEAESSGADDSDESTE